MNKLQQILFSLLCIGLLLLVIYRAQHLSFTHDESASYNYFKNENTLARFFDSSFWLSANNHVFNTLGFQFFTKIFGHSDLTMRMTSILAFIGFCIVSYLFLFKEFVQNVSRIAFVLILFINPYFIDFFSLNRGYALSATFHLFALFAFIKFIKHRKTWQIHMAFASLSLACIACFMYVLLYPVYLFTLILLLNKPIKKTTLLIAFSYSITTALLLYIPLRALASNGELDYGVLSIWDSIKSMSRSYFLGQYLFFNNYYLVFTASLFLLLTMTIIYVVKNWRSNTLQLKFIFTSISILIIYMHLALLLFHSHFPSERKTTLYFPLIALAFAYFLPIALKKKWNYIWSIILAFTIVFNATKFNPNLVTEWYYDQDTKALIEKINEDSMGKEVVIQSHWLFHPTLQYYISSKEYKHIQLLPYDKNIGLQEPKPDYLVLSKDEQINPSNYENSLYDHNYIICLKNLKK